MENTTSEKFYEEPKYKNRNGKLYRKPLYHRQTVPFFGHDGDDPCISKSDILKYARDIIEPISFIRESVYILPREHAVRSTVYTYMKIFPETTMSEILRSAFEFRVDQKYITYEICYKNHISNNLLRQILEKIKTGEKLHVSKLSDLGGSVRSILSNIKKIRDKEVILHISGSTNVDLTFDFAPIRSSNSTAKTYDDTSYKMLDFFLEIYKGNSISSSTPKKASIPVTINDFSDEFLKFYYEYNKIKSETAKRIGTTIQDYSKQIGLSQSTVYKKIAWLNAHPFEVSQRYKHISGLNYNESAPFLKKKNRRAYNIYMDSLKEKEEFTFFNYIVDLSKKKQNITSDDYIVESYVFYYKVTSDTSLDDIIKFCNYCNNFLYEQIEMKQIQDYYKLAKKIVWEYSYHSKEVSSKFRKLLCEEFNGCDIVIQNFSSLSRYPTKLFHIMKKLFTHYGQLCSPRLTISDIDFEFLKEIFENLEKASTASNKPERRGRPRLSRDDLPKDFFPFYNEYKQLKNSQSPLNGIVAKYANESGYSIKTIYDWINRVSQEKL